MDTVGEFDRLLADVRAWHLRVFGHPVHVKRTAQKLLEEAAEAFAEARADNSRMMLHELVDVLLVTCSLLSIYGPRELPMNILAEVRRKMSAVEQRDQRARDRKRLG